jgi:DNA-directed RNA polymerase subunit RPC12/RpoP
MVISSRTPEGTPNRCVVCGHKLKVEPSIDTEDAPCPHCGHLLWFFAPDPRTGSRTPTYEAFVMRQGEQALGPFPSYLRPALFVVVDRLKRQKRLPERPEVAKVVNSSPSWEDVILNLHSKAARSLGWAYAAGEFAGKMRRKLNRLLTVK